MSGRLFKFVIAALLVWIASSFVAFLLAFILSYGSAPRWMEVPWSDVGDFVEGPDGRVYVHTRFYSRVLCYDRSGSFVASYPFPVPGGGSTEMAAGANGLIYCRQSNSVFAFTGSWEEVWRAKEDYRREGYWKMGEDGRPLFVPDEKAEGLTLDRPVRPGERLFVPGSGSSSKFTAEDGTETERSWLSIRRRTPDGRTTPACRSPLYLAPVVFPFPGALAWIAFALLVLLRKPILRRLRESRDPADAPSPGEALLGSISLPEQTPGKLYEMKVHGTIMGCAALGVLIAVLALWSFFLPIAIGSGAGLVLGYFLSRLWTPPPADPTDPHEGQTQIAARCMTGILAVNLMLFLLWFLWARDRKNPMVGGGVGVLLIIAGGAVPWLFHHFIRRVLRKVE